MHAEIVSAAHTGNHTIFVSGPPGSGKTTLATQRVRYLLEKGVPAEQILILVPQRTLASPYYQALGGTDSPAGGQVDVVTIGGLARRTIDLFWPLVGAPAGFAHPDRRPRFLTLETAQYHMDHIAEPFIAAGAFDGITISRGRLVSQIIDNLNKAAAVGFPPDEIARRLKQAWSGESARHRIYEQVQALALAFRTTCLENNLLDWSLQIGIFWQYLLPLPQLRRYLLGGYRHIIADNIEEDIPATHDLLRDWLPLCESALLAYDSEGGYRVFLGADPEGALALAEQCSQRIRLAASHIMTPEVAALGTELAESVAKTPDTRAIAEPTGIRTQAPAVGRTDARRALVKPTESIGFHPQMLDWVCEQISRLVFEEGLPAGEIAVLAPFLSDALRFSLAEKLERFHIDVRSHRPSRELREEPAARSLLTLAKLAHPNWRRIPPVADVAQALAEAIEDLDPVRARLLTDIVFRVRDGWPALTPFHQIVPDTQARISYLLGGRYEELRRWIQGHIESNNGSDMDEHLDHFLSRLFGEVLSQPGYGFHRDFDAGAVAANLIESVRKFRLGYWPPTEAGLDVERQTDPRQEYVDMVERGVVAAQYISSWKIHPEDAVLLVPAHTFLMMNQPVTVQFWLDAGSDAWFQRIYQPLTHPYVLRRDWPEDGIWTDEDEVRSRHKALARLVLGLTRRCRQRIYLAYSQLNERGYEQQGLLLQAVQRMLRRSGGEVT